MSQPTSTSEHQKQQKSPPAPPNLFKINGLRESMLGALVAVVIAVVGQLVVGGVSGNIDALQSLQAALPSMRFIGSAAITASSTVLALILTLLGLSRRSEREFSGTHYRRIGIIAKANVALLTLAMLHLVLLSIPIGESVEITPMAYTIAYYVYVGTTSLLSGGFIAMVLMLYFAIDSLMTPITPYKQQS